MIRGIHTLAALILGLGFLQFTKAFSQEPGAFKWKPGQVLHYQVQHVTEVQEKVGDSTTEFKNRLDLQKRWQVEKVTPNGIATLTLTIPTIKMETTSPKGETLSYDSTKPGEGSKELKAQLEKYTTGKIAVVFLDTQGRLRGVKESNFGAAEKYKVELPFSLVVPEGKISKDLAWVRDFTITLDPPQGTGEKFETTQRFECTDLQNQLTTIKITTQLKAAPANEADWIPLLPFLPEGEAVLDTQAGILKEAVLKTDRTIKGHQGEGSSYRFHSVFRETLSSVR
ncbi:MAG: hypothetical protein EXR99_00875 [Gemmataceae bacterium]|nr:hypothetical protein [Gemmataceae bacterium]